MDNSQVLADIGTRVGEKNLSRSCQGNGCKVSMEGIAANRILADADRAFPAHGWDGKRCDYVLFLFGTTDMLWVAPLELKSGRVDVSDAVKQLQRGADFANCFAPTECKATCRPVLFHGRRIHPKDRKVLNRAKIRFRQSELAIKTARCGHARNLAQALST